MTWQENVAAIARARLMLLPAESVYQELKAYGAEVEANILFSGDPALEKALLLRGEPLIDLALAQYGSDLDVVSGLYERARTGPGDHARAICLAVLANRSVLTDLIFGSRYGPISSDEARRLLTSKDGEALRVWLRNPAAKKMLADLFERKAPFDNLPDDAYLSLVGAATPNPALSEDRGNEFGPDLQAWDIHKGIRTFLTSGPITEHACEVFYLLLTWIDPERASHFDEDPRPVFARWQALKISEAFAKRWDDTVYTELTLRDEFCCLLGALYGQWFPKRPPDSKTMKIECAGTANSSDIVLRCAYYGCAQMTPEEMNAAHNQDGNVFTFAALFNGMFFWDPQRRAALEAMLRGRLFQLYQRRCEQIHKRKPEFNVKPVTDDATEILKEDEVDSGEPQDLKRLEARLEATFAALNQRITSLHRVLTWGTVGIAVLLVLALSRIIK